VRQKYREIVSRLMAPGAVGMAVLLGAAAPSMANQAPAAPTANAGERVSERLAAIREAVSAASESQIPAPADERRLAWHNWGNGGFGFGFGSPWANFGFGAPWSNWNNWHNWNNWRNGWGNW